MAVRMLEIWNDRFKLYSPSELLGFFIWHGNITHFTHFRCARLIMRHNSAIAK